jgi:hypothetical protein
MTSLMTEAIRTLIEQDQQNAQAQANEFERRLTGALGERLAGRETICMSAEFIDTNILIYAHDGGAGAKHQRAVVDGGPCGRPALWIGNGPQSVLRRPGPQPPVRSPYN